MVVVILMATTVALKHLHNLDTIHTALQQKKKVNTHLSETITITDTTMGSTVYIGNSNARAVDALCHALSYRGFTPQTNAELSTVCEKFLQHDFQRCDEHDQLGIRVRLH